MACYASESIARPAPQSLPTAHGEFAVSLPWHSAQLRIFLLEAGDRGAAEESQLDHVYLAEAIPIEPAISDLANSGGIPFRLVPS